MPTIPQALRRMIAPHHYFHQIHFSYQFRYHPEHLRTAVRASDSPRHLPEANELGLPLDATGMCALSTQIWWSPSLFLRYEFYCGDEPTEVRILTRYKESTIDEATGKEHLLQHHPVWMCGALPFSEAEFEESTVNNTALHYLIGSEVLAPGNFLLADRVSTIDEDPVLHLDRKVTQLLIEIQNWDNLRQTPPDIEDFLGYCQRFELWVDDETGIVLVQSGYFEQHLVYQGTVTFLSLNQFDQNMEVASVTADPADRRASRAKARTVAIERSRADNRYISF